MWEKGIANDIIMKELEVASSRDFHFSDGRVISSMCTEPLEIARIAHNKFIEANLGNAGMYPGTLDLERQVIKGIGQLLGNENTAGGILSGGTEANITALWLARNITGKKKVIFPKSAHFSFHKACDILAMEPVMVDLNENFTIDIDQVAAKIDDELCAIVGIAGTTELGAVDDIPALAELVPENAFLHVDAAFGGFVLPFLENSPKFDFSIPEVASINSDPHKMGMATIPSGALLVREREWIRKIHKDAPYLDMSGQLSALSGTRSSAAVAATYAAMRSLGRDGYVKLVEQCMDVTGYALQKARKLGLKPVMEPLMNILCLYVPEPRSIQKKLDVKGWKVSVAQNPKSLRLVIMPHVTHKSIDGMFADLEESIT